MADWKIWIDTGGTFTDCIAIDTTGNYKRLKVLSSGVLRGRIIKQINSQTFEVEINWPVDQDLFKNFTLSHIDSGKSVKIKSIDLVNNIIHTAQPIKGKFDLSTIEISSREEVPVFAARLLTKTSFNKSFPEIEMKLGSTRGTNALLERKGAKTIFITTKGFKDLLVIGTQQRPDLFALKIEKEKPLYSAVLEVNERIDSGGKILQKLTNNEIDLLIQQVKKIKADSVAIALLNSYKNPAHEIKLEKLFLKAGIKFVSVSHRLSTQIKILPRAETTIVNAYLAPIIHTYLTNIQYGLAKGTLKVMTSAGSLTGLTKFLPKDSLLSGPAGGVVGAATTAKKSGVDQLITFDMGGTSTDVTLYHKRYDYRFESKVGGIKIVSPSLAIETIAAGGGSICEYDGYKLMVGPQSAGASPGPACYGAGGPLTITDVNLLLGKLSPDFFALPIHLNKAQEALEKVILKIKKSSRKTISSSTLLESFVQIANEKMAEAIKRVSVQHGYNPSDYSLLSFGGAGGQHACALAEMLDMKKIIIPYDAGLLSAYGIGRAKTERFEEKLILKNLTEIKNSISSIINELFNKGEKQLTKENDSKELIQLNKKLIYLRLKGQESSIEIEFKKPESIKSLFRKKYKFIYGHWISNREIEVESVKVLVSVKSDVTNKKIPAKKNYSPAASKKQNSWIQGKSEKIDVFEWELLYAGAEINGPAIVASKNSTTFVDSGWHFKLDQHNNAILSFTSQNNKKQKSFSDLALLELFSNRFTSIAQEMGAVLQRTSFSVNVKERLDFSCAVLDADGYLIVNAPHIPVHLGSMGVCVREVKKVLKIEEGDVVITNHPAYGGSHLPDVTLIKPVFYNKKLIGYVANRAHHSEIGGKKPGSMPVDATNLSEEGVIIEPCFLVKNHNARWTEMEKLFLEAKYPTRSVQENLADLNGALASVNLGEKNLIVLCEKYGEREVKFYMMELKKYAASLLKEKLKMTGSKIYKAQENLDDGSILKATLSTQRSKLIVDFSGSAKIHAGNLNATQAIVQSVVLYVLRLWVNKPIAMNEGLMENVRLILPKGLLNPFADFKVTSKNQILPAVVGGNTEVSQRLTDTLLKALGLVACSQGTMNNFLFGNSKLGYYETIGGGTGAGEGFNGADAVHSHMTNTRITDPEILELRYPVLLKRFEVRKNSGGKGKWKGGNGITREIIFKEKMDVNILSQHRKEKPYEMKDGKPGKTGMQFFKNRYGKITKLKGMDSLSVNEGDSIIIHTPGGGGWGK